VSPPMGVVKFDPPEMTVRVCAGTPLAELDAELDGYGQWVNLSGPPTATVGGSLAVGHTGLDRLGRGPVRDALLEVTYVSAEGLLVRGGGPTVKNVTGYDLPKLFVGSLGTLGFIGEVVLRSNPAPEVSSWLAGDVEPSVPRSSIYRPQAVLWDGIRCWVLLAGRGVDVAADAAVLEALGLEEVDAPPALPPHRWSIAPRDVGAFVDQGMSFVAEVGVGVVHAAEPQPRRGLDASTMKVQQRIKQIFDPTERLNPGRSVL
jgi:FAD/FMN-containing dehydrogenase